MFALVARIFHRVCMFRTYEITPPELLTAFLQQVTFTGLAWKPGMGEMERIRGFYSQLVGGGGGAKNPGAGIFSKCLMNPVGGLSCMEQTCK